MLHNTHCIIFYNEEILKFRNVLNNNGILATFYCLLFLNIQNCLSEIFQ